MQNSCLLENLRRETFLKISSYTKLMTFRKFETRVFSQDLFLYKIHVFSLENYRREVNSSFEMKFNICVRLYSTVLSSLMLTGYSNHLTNPCLRRHLALHHRTLRSQYLPHISDHTHIILWRS